MRRLVIGDLHANLKGLKQCLKRAKVTKHDHLIFLGDLFDGRGDAKDLTLYLLNYLLKKDWVVPPTFIIGNHDIWLKRYLTTGLVTSLWDMEDGRTTRASIDQLDSSDKVRLLELLNNMLPYTVLEGNAFVHGGYTHDSLGLEWNDSNYSWDRSLWNKSLMWEAVGPREGQPLPTRNRSYREIFIGHSSVSRVGSSVPVKAANVWNLDTGSGKYGYLTIMDVDTKEFWQSDQVTKLYGNSRN